MSLRHRDFPYRLVNLREERFPGTCHGLYPFVLQESLPLAMQEIESLAEGVLRRQTFYGVASVMERFVDGKQLLEQSSPGLSGCVLLLALRSPAEVLEIGLEILVARGPVSLGFLLRSYARGRGGSISGLGFNRRFGRGILRIVLRHPSGPVDGPRVLVVTLPSRWKGSILGSGSRPPVADFRRFWGLVRSNFDPVS
jgi:hypothetical protein